MCQCDKLVATQKESLPTKAKKTNEPVFIWIWTPIHRKFVNNHQREKFWICLEKCAAYHDNTYSLKLKKVWDKNDVSLFNNDDKKFTAAGFKAYWIAIDTMVKYADTLLLKKELAISNKNLKYAGQEDHPQRYKHQKERISNKPRGNRYHRNTTNWKKEC